MADQLKGAASGVQNTLSSGAEKASSAVQNPTAGASEGDSNWEGLTEEQKKQAFDSIPAEKKQNLTYMEWIQQGYHNQKENWMPWIEDVYLKWFTNDNKASYATKSGLDKTKVTGVEQVDTVQDSLNNAVGSQVGKGGVLQPVGDYVSKEGVNRAERGGKDDSGSYGGAAAGYAKSAGGSVMTGAKSAGQYVGSMFGGQKEGAGETQ